MLVGVCVPVVVLLWAASRLSNDWLATFGCFAAIGLAVCVLDYTGRKEAARRPNRLYRAERLPGDGRIQIIILMTVLIALLVFVSATIKPGQHASAFPYFIAAAFVFLVMPWLVAKRTISNAAKGKTKHK